MDKISNGHLKFRSFAGGNGNFVAFIPLLSSLERVGREPGP